MRMYHKKQLLLVEVPNSSINGHRNYVRVYAVLRSTFFTGVREFQVVTIKDEIVKFT